MGLILEGIHVVDLTIARAGPHAVRQLAEYGATVTRVEIPNDVSGIGQDHNGSDYINLHGNKRLITIDLKQDEGHRILFQLLENADVFVENFRPPVKEALQIGYSDLAEKFPGLIYASISGFGQSGPLADKGAVDQIIQGFAGVMSVTGSGDPTRAGIAVADMAAGTFLANGILLALLDRQRTTVGQWVQVSLLEATISFLDFQAARWVVDRDNPGPAGNDHPTLTPMGTFNASDGYLNLAAPTDRLWSRLCEAIGDSDLTNEPSFSTTSLRQQNKEDLKARLQAALSERTRQEWVEVLDAAGVPCGPVNSVAEVFEDPQVVDLEMTTPVNHPTRGDISVLRNPLTLSRAEQAKKTPSPMPGQHTDEVLRELGYSNAQIAELRSRAVV
jgi:crotonobetainyl-CoA:carnitine CoA-transferase CaiB-like acyl-CoA transferase